MHIVCAFDDEGGQCRRTTRPIHSLIVRFVRGFMISYFFGLFHFLWVVLELPDHKQSAERWK